MAAPALAQDAAWNGNGTATGDWNTAANWSPATVPTGTATFGANTTSTVNFSNAATIDTIAFDSGASAYTLNTAGNSLDIAGDGILNSSGVTQTLNNDSFLSFLNAASAGDLVLNNTAGFTMFGGTSTASTATITSSAIMAFNDFSVAGSATITVNNSLTAFTGNADGDLARLITNAGGTVDFSQTSGVFGNGVVNVGSIEGAGTFSLGGNQLLVGGNNLSATVSGVIGDGGIGGGGGASLVKVGTGTLTLSGANTFSGGLTIAEGTVSLAHNSAAGSGNITATGSVIDFANGVDIANTLIIASDTTQLQVLTGATATHSGFIVEDNPGRPLEKIAAGTLIVNAATNSGATLISEGTWAGGAANAFSAASIHTVEAGATLDLGGFDQTIDSLFGAGTVTNSGGSNAILSIGNFTTSTNSSVFSGVIQDGLTSTLELIVDAPGITTLTGDNTYTGGTLICDCSTLQLGDGGTSGSILGNVTHNGLLIFNRSDDYDFGGDIVQGFGTPGIVEQRGAGILTLSGTGNNYVGGTIISGGTLSIDDDARLGAPVGGVTISNGATLLFSSDVFLDVGRTVTLGTGGGVVDTNQNFNNEINGTITGSGSLTVNGQGDLFLGGVNDFTGGLTVGSDTFVFVDNVDALGAATNNITLNNGGLGFGNDMIIGSGRTLTLGAGDNVLDMNGTNVEIAATITGVGRLVVTNGCGCVPGLTLSAANDYSGGTLVENFTTLTITDDGNLGTGDITLDGGELAFGANMTLAASRTITLDNLGGIFETNGFTATIAGDIAGTGDVVLLNPGTLVLAGNVSNDGNIFVDGGTLVLTGTASHTGGTVVGVFGPGTLQIGDGGTTGALAPGSPVVVAGDLIFNRSNTLTFDNVIADCGCGTEIIEQKGSGTTILTATNTYAGTTLVTAGTLQINNADAMGTSIVTLNGGALQAGADGLTLVNNVAINSTGGAVSVTGSDGFTLSSVIADGNGSGALTKTGSGTLILTNTNTYTGGTTVSAGTLQVGDGGATGALGGGAIVTNGTLAFNRSAATAISAAISGTGGITQMGSAALQVSAAQSYGGATTINAGTQINLTGAGAVSDSVNIVSDGTFDISGIAPTGTSIKALTGGGFVPLGDKTLTITAGTGVFSGVISGNGSVVFAGGVTTLTGTNTYSGGTTVDGTLILGSSGSAGTGPITTTGSVISYADGVVINNPIVLGSNTTQLQALAGVTATQVGVISETGGSRPIEKIGTGTLIINTASTYTGATTITAGTWRAGAANVLIANGAYNVAGVLDLNNFANTIGSLSGAGSVTLGSAAFTTGGNGASTTFSGVISGSGSLTKTGAGTLILSGTNLHTGTTTITTGTVQIGAGGTSGSLAGSIVNNSALSFNRSDAATVANSISGTGTLTQSGSGNLVLTGTKTYTGATAVNAGTLSVNGSIAASSGVTVANGGTLGGTGTVSGTTVQSGGTLAPGNSIGTLNIAGNLALNAGSIFDVELNATTNDKAVATGTASLAGQLQLRPEAVTYTAGTVYTLVTSGGALTGTFASTNTVGSFGGLVPILSYDARNAYMTLASATFGWKAAPGTSDFNTASNWTSELVPGAGATGIFGTSSVSTITSSATTTLAGLVFNSGASAYTFNLANNGGASTVFTLSGTGITNNSSNAPRFNLTGNGAATATLAFTNAAAAGDAILTANSGGVVRFAGTSTGDNAQIVLGGGTLDLSSHTGGITLGSVTGTSGAVTLGAVTLTSGGNGTLGAVISGTGGFTKTGSGTLILSGANTYTGATILNAGTLVVNGSITSAVTANGGVLKGSGSTGNVTIASGAAIAPGNSIGTLNVANLTLSSGSAYQVEVNAAGQSDLLNASGTASLGGASLQVLPESGTYAPVTTYRFLNAAGGITGTFGSVTSSAANLTPALLYGTNSVDLRLVRNDLSFAAIAAGGSNQTAVGNAVSAGGVGSTLYLDAANVAATPSILRTALDQLSGEIHATVLASQLEAASVSRRTLIDRMRRQDARAGGVSLWGNVAGSWGSLDGDGNAAGATRSGVNVALGADTSLSANWRGGLEGGYSENNVTTQARSSGAGVRSGHLGAYAQGQYDAVHLRTGFLYGFGTASTLRNVSVAAFTNGLASSQDASSVQLFGEIGYEFAAGGITLEPFAGLAWSQLELGAFSETGGGVASVSGTSRAVDDGYLTLGFEADTSGFAFAGGVLTPGLRAGWQHALTNAVAARNLTFLSTSQSFLVRGPAVDSDRAVLDLDLALALGDDTSVTLGYFGSYSGRGSDKGVRLTGAVRF